MQKTIRIVISILAVITLFGGIAAAILTYRMNRNNRYRETWEITEADTQSSSETAFSAVQKEGSRTEEGSEIKKDTVGAADHETEPVSETEITTAGETEDKTTLILTGDVLFDKAFRAGYDAAGIDGVIESDLRQRLYDADILMINHEFPFSDRGTPMEDKQFTFRCSPSYVTALTQMGVDIASLANNHALDFGKDALTDTFAALDSAGIRYAGAGNTVERAEQLQIMEVNGRRFGFLAVTRVVPDVSWKIEFETPGLFSCYDETRLVELVSQARTECDFLVVYPHWGIERQEVPEDYQTVIARKCIEAGADAIVGAHSHCLQSIEYIQGKPVFYSLGNFIFNYTIERTAYLEITIDQQGDPTYRIVPAYAKDGVTRLADTDRAAETIKRLNEISNTAFVSDDGRVAEK